MTTQLTGSPVAVGQQLLVDSSTQNHTLGAYIETNDGRGFRYASIGATSTVVGKLYQASAQDTTNLNPSGGLSVSAAAVGTNQVTITSSITLALNLLAGGLMAVNVTPGAGQVYKVKGNTAVSSAANCVVTLEDPIVSTALTTSSKVVFCANPYSLVIVNPATASSSPVGVAQYAITNGNYGWLQTHGACALLNDSATAVGLGVSPSASVAGASKTAASTACSIGYALQVGVTTEYDFVYLTID